MTDHTFQHSVSDSPLGQFSQTLRTNVFGLFITVALAVLIAQVGQFAINLISYLHFDGEFLQTYIDGGGSLISLVLGTIHLRSFIFYLGVLVLLLAYKRLYRFSFTNVMLCLCTLTAWIVANWLFSMGMGASFPDFFYELLSFNEYLTRWFSKYGESMNVFAIPNMLFNGMTLCLIFSGLHGLGLGSTTPETESLSSSLLYRIILIGYGMVLCAILAGKGSDSLYYLIKWAMDMALLSDDTFLAIDVTSLFFYFLLSLADIIFCCWFFYRLVLYFYDHVTPIRSGRCIQALLLSALSFWIFSYLILAVTTIVLHKIQPNGRMIDHMGSFLCLLVASGLCFGLCYKLKNKTLRIVIITLLIASVVTSFSFYDPDALDFPGAKYSETFIAIYSCVLIPILYLCALVFSLQLGMRWINRLHRLDTRHQN